MQANVQICNQDNELIASDSFHTIGLGTTTITVEYGGEIIYIDLVIRETGDGTVNKPVVGKVISTDRFQVDIENLRQVMPPMTIGPVELGDLTGRIMTLILEIQAIQKTQSKRISYSLYLGGAHG